MTFGFVAADNLPGDHYLPNNAGTMLVGRKTKKHYAKKHSKKKVVSRKKKKPVKPA